MGTRSSSASAASRPPPSPATSTRPSCAALELDAALTHLESLPGIGPFGAMLILARGAGHPDVPPPTLRRFRQAVAAAYGLERGARRGEARVAERGVAALSGVDHVPPAERGHDLIPPLRMRTYVRALAGDTAGGPGPDRCAASMTARSLVAWVCRARRFATGAGRATSLASVAAHAAGVAFGGSSSPIDDYAELLGLYLGDGHISQLGSHAATAASASTPSTRRS